MNKNDRYIFIELYYCDIILWTYTLREYITIYINCRNCPRQSRTINIITYLSLSVKCFSFPFKSSHNYFSFRGHCQLTYQRCLNTHKYTFDGTRCTCFVLLGWWYLPIIPRGPRPRLLYRSSVKSRKISVSAVDFCIRFVTSKVVILVFESNKLSSKNRRHGLVTQRVEFRSIRTYTCAKLIRRGNTYLLCNKRSSCPRGSLIDQ